MTFKYKGYSVFAKEEYGVLTGTVHFPNNHFTKICGATRSEFQRCFKHAVNGFLYNNAKE